MVRIREDIRLSDKALTVRAELGIVEDYKENFLKFQSLIKRCFIYLYWKRYPDMNRSGQDESYNNLYYQFYHHRVFERFNPDRPNAAKAPSKALQQFLFNWVESILSAEYTDRLRYSNRYLLSPKENLTPFKQSSMMDESTLNIQKQQYENAINRAARKNKKNRTLPNVPYRKFPDTPHNPDVSESIEFKLSSEKIYACCQSKQDQTILDLTQEGYSPNEIAEVLSTDRYSILKAIGKIRRAYVQNYALY